MTGLIMVVLLWLALILVIFDLADAAKRDDKHDRDPYWKGGWRN